MIRRKKLFITGVSLFLLSVILGFTYPHGQPFGATVFHWLNIPVHSNMEEEMGLYYPGILITFSFLVSLILINHSLAKHHFKTIGGALALGIFGPIILMGGYQKFVASGVHAFSYEKDFSECEFTTSEDERTLHGECWIPLKNHSNEDVEFTLEFRERKQLNRFRFNSIMNEEGPYKLTLHRNSSQIFHIKADIDVSSMSSNQYPNNGSSTGVDIHLSDNHQQRSFSNY